MQRISGLGKFEQVSLKNIFYFSSSLFLQWRELVLCTIQSKYLGFGCWQLVGSSVFKMVILTPKPELGELKDCHNDCRELHLCLPYPYKSHTSSASKYNSSIVSILQMKEKRELWEWGMNLFVPKWPALWNGEALCWKKILNSGIQHSCPRALDCCLSLGLRKSSESNKFSWCVTIKYIASRWVEPCKTRRVFSSSSPSHTLREQVEGKERRERSGLRQDEARQSSLGYYCSSN